MDPVIHTIRMDPIAFKVSSKEKNLFVFGKGEEIRDHIFVNDVGDILKSIIKKI